jgi:hypothetical protein
MDKVELLVIALRAERDWLGLSPVDQTSWTRTDADRIEAVVDAVLKACADDLRHLGDIDHLNAWIGLYEAADRLEELR